MAEKHISNSIKGYRGKYYKKRHPEWFKAGSFSSEPHSRNRNPSAVRSVDGRQTYQGRDYPGNAGDFLEEQKILIRYNENDLFDMDVIEDLTNRIEEIANSHERYDNEVLEFGKEVIEQALEKYTPIDTGNLVSHWEVTVDYENGKVNIDNPVEYASNQEYGMYGDQYDVLTKQSLWYPGYFMMTKSIHEGEIAMREYARLLQSQLQQEESKS